MKAPIRKNGSARYFSPPSTWSTDAHMVDSLRVTSAVASNAAASGSRITSPGSLNCYRLPRVRHSRAFNGQAYAAQPAFEPSVFGRSWMADPFSVSRSLRPRAFGSRRRAIRLIPLRAMPR